MKNLFMDTVDYDDIAEIEEVFYDLAEVFLYYTDRDADNPDDVAVFTEFYEMSNLEHDCFVDALRELQMAI